MTNRPIPRHGLLGCWFLSDRGITYDSGTNEAIDRSGKGNHATYQNGVTVGVEGDPEREFGAAGFDAGSNQHADVGKTLQKTGPQAVVAIFKYDDTSAEYVITSNYAGDGFLLDVNRTTSGELAFGFRDTNDIFIETLNQIEPDTYHSAVGVLDGGLKLFTNGSLADTASFGSVDTEVIGTLNIGASANTTQPFNGEIAAVGRYDLSIPNAPEPSEIARRWDRLTDIPATR